MNHSFDTEDAQKYGVNSAIILQHIKFWIEKNKANDKHFHEGEHWTYSSVKALEEIFPYLTQRNIRSAIENLESMGAIRCGNYNESSCNRTKWFSGSRADERWPL